MSKSLLPLPPGPPRLPIIGNLHQQDMSDLSDHLWRLSKHYGPLMSIRLGMVQTLIVSSADMAKEVMKTNDLNFCTRPVLPGLQTISYDFKDIAYSPYNEYWKQMRKIFTLKSLLSETYKFPFMGWLDKLNGSIARLEKNVQDMDEFYQQLIDEHLNPDRQNIMQEDMVDILLKLKHDPDSSVNLTFDLIKALLMDILIGGTDTTAATVVWVIVLYPVAPLLVPRETIDRCVINGHEIPKKTLVYVNAWAVGRDPNCWERPEFIGSSSSIDYKGTDFGSGRRICPMAAVTVEMRLSNLIY
nr:cytochrome P450 [Tanacetum cinerariifolium]